MEKGLAEESVGLLQEAVTDIKAKLKKATGYCEIHSRNTKALTQAVERHKADIVYKDRVIEELRAAEEKTIQQGSV